MGARHAVACATGTAAIHIGLTLLGVERGDEVFCSDFTFVGSVNPIAYTGATPVFVDSELTTWNMDPELVVGEIEERAVRGQRMPAAIEVVHILGQPANITPILDVCERHGVPVLEDAAESLGARWSGGALAGRATGAVGRVGAFSFNGNKIATTGGGGMLVTYTLSDVALWSDGTPMSAADFECTWQATVNTSGSIITAGYDLITSVE